MPGPPCSGRHFLLEVMPKGSMLNSGGPRHSNGCSDRRKLVAPAGEWKGRSANFICRAPEPPQIADGSSNLRLVDAGCRFEQENLFSTQAFLRVGQSRKTSGTGLRGISTSLNDLAIFPGVFPSIVISVAWMKAKKTQAAPDAHDSDGAPPLPCRGSGLASITPRRLQYKIRRAEIMPDSCRASTSWKLKTEKAETDFPSTNKTLGHHAVPRSGTYSHPRKHARQVPEASASGSPSGEKQAVLTDSLPRSLPGETSNHGAKATY